MSKVVVSSAEVRQAIKAMGRRTMTMHRRRKLAKQLKAQKMLAAGYPTAAI